MDVMNLNADTTDRYTCYILQLVALEIPMMISQHAITHRSHRKGSAPYVFTGRLDFHPIILITFTLKAYSGLEYPTTSNPKKQQNNLQYFCGLLITS